MKKRCSSSRARHSRGVSLIEILVGLAIALIAALIIFQVFAASGERVRTTTSGSDAQVAGTLALYQVERDIRLAGLGFGMVPAAGVEGGVTGCAVAAYNSTLATPAIPNVVLTPVQIIHNATTPGAPDQIVVMYGDSAYFVTSRAFNGSTATSKMLVRRDAFHLGDIVLVTNNGTSAATGVCALVEITGNTNIDGVTVDHVPSANYTSFYGGARTASMNAADTTVATAGLAYNLGPTPSRNVWQVTPAGAASANMLVWSNTLRSDTLVRVTDGIVNLQAEYGVDTSVTTPPAGTVSSWTSVAPADWTKVLALRFAVLARSQQYEKTAVTTVAPTWANGAHSFAMFNVDGTTDSTPGDANDWRHYRYRVYESTVPLRNMIWGAAP